MTETQQLIKELWSLWASMAECGELQIGPTFSKQYDELKKRVAEHLHIGNVSGSAVCRLGDMSCKCKARTYENFLKDGCEHYR